MGSGWDQEWYRVGSGLDEWWLRVARRWTGLAEFGSRVYSELAWGVIRGGLRLLQEWCRVGSGLAQEGCRVCSGLAQGWMGGGGPCAVPCPHISLASSRSAKTGLLYTSDAGDE